MLARGSAPSTESDTWPTRAAWLGRVLLNGFAISQGRETSVALVWSLCLASFSLGRGEQSGPGSSCRCFPLLLSGRVTWLEPPQRLAPVGESWGGGGGVGRVFFFYILLLCQLPRIYHAQIVLLHLTICESAAWWHSESRAVTGLSGRYTDVGVAGRSLSGPFFLFLQAKLLFSDGKKVVPRLPHEQAVPKVKVVIVPRGLHDL